MKNVMTSGKKETDLIRFFRNEQSDTEGRMLEDILQFAPIKIECCHDFIQWIFPTKEKSAVNENAPTIDDTFAHRLLQDEKASCNFCKSCRLYLNYIGFRCDEGKLCKAPNPYMFYQLPTHNLLRITRMLNSLNQTGHSSCSKQLYSLLEEEIRMHPNRISAVTLHYWASTQEG